MAEPMAVLKVDETADLLVVSMGFATVALTVRETVVA